MKDPVNDTEMAAVFEAGRAAAAAPNRFVEWEGLPLMVSANGSLEVVDDALAIRDKRQPAPMRRSGVYNAVELDGFIEYLRRYKQPETVVFADPARFSLDAVINADPAGADPSKAGWKDHRLRYAAPRSPEWLFWTERENKVLTQDVFADILDQRLEDLASAKGFPEPAEMLEMARNLMVRVGSSYTRKLNPTTGEGELISKTENSSESTKIPRAFRLALRVFEGGEHYAVEARIRFTMAEGSPKFAFVLHRRQEIERDAFGDVRKAVATKLNVPVFAGSIG
jgi:uncharacterized protein YfdQ (DUF2303 family)